MTRIPPKPAGELLYYMPGLPPAALTLHRLRHTFGWSGSITQQMHRVLSDPTNSLTKTLASKGVFYDADKRLLGKPVALTADDLD